MRVARLSFGSDPCLREKCALLYCEIFREPPWREEFWTVSQVLTDLSVEAAKPGFSGFLAIADKEVVGFTWGYFVEKTDVRQISGHNGLDYLFASNERPLFYIDELGVKSTHRGMGFGRQLTIHLIEAAKDMGVHSVILRTSKNAERAKAVYVHAGFVDLQIEDSSHEDRTYWLLTL
ncbi:MAG: GNAT family N-acetyltransferase [Candidatus Staskawiczbacteria bacterium]|jgi:ribosomal protein S18 acetylase RimI-like enzyme